MIASTPNSLKISPDVQRLMGLEVRPETDAQVPGPPGHALDVATGSAFVEDECRFLERHLWAWEQDRSATAPADLMRIVPPSRRIPQ